MSSVKGALSVLLCGSMIALGGTQALAKTYDVAELANGFAITGSIVTDGQFGVLSQSDILSWNLTIFTNAINVTLTGPTSVPTGRVVLGGSGLTADNFGLYFNFTFGNTFNVLQFQQFDQSNLFQNSYLISLESIGSEGLLIQIVDQLGHLTSASIDPPRANLQFAIDPTAVATPLPGALPLFATGLGALGLLGWRRKRKATV